MTVSPTRFIRARMIDATGSAPVDDAVLVVDQQGLISYAGPADRAPRPAGEQVVDLAGRTLLPGFFDCHVHFSSPGVSALMQIGLRGSLRAFQSAERMRATLQAGVTTARDLGGVDAGFREAVETGLIVGPRLHTAVRILSHTGGHGDLTLPSGIDLADGLGDLAEIADTVDEVRLSTRRVIRDGADVIKLCATGGVSSPTDQPDDEGLTQEEIAAVVDEARRHRGRPVAAHAQGTAGILNAVQGGVTSIEHGYAVDDECIDLMLERGTFLVPTLSSATRVPERGTVPEYLYQKKVRWSAIAQENIANALQRGVKVALGTDAGICPHGRNLEELVYLVKLGLTPMQAIQAGTRNAAELLGLSEDLGTLEPGNHADLVVCDGDPLAGIDVLADPANIVFVTQEGRTVKDLLTTGA